MRSLLIAAVFALELWAIASVLGHRRNTARLLWILAIVGLPVAGALVWLLRGRTVR